MVPKLAAALLICAGLATAAAPAIPGDERAAAHVLNRLAYGPRPGDVEAVRRLGVAAWIEQQLHPSRLDDGALEARLDAFTTLTLDTRTIVQEFDRPALDERRARQRAAAAEPSAAPDAAAGTAPTAAQVNRRRVLDELAQAKLLRAIYSERQLEAVLTDAWFNHFNVFAGKGPTRSYVTAYERDAIRPHVLGRFRDLLGATARHPAMLFYLDNWENVDPAAGERLARRGARRAAMPRPDGATARPPRGLNENYARELLELHTLGVDGGYTQADVEAVARAFTGWTMQPREGSGFRFVPALHDRGAKTVLGHTLPAGRGIEDGEAVLDLLAAHPATARHVARMLATRFVSDTPPDALVEQAAARFLATSGDLREVVRVIVTSPAFFASEAIGAKLKTPLEFVASALRAAGADVRSARPLARTLRDLGMPLYFCQPPTGYDDTAAAWAAPGALVGRVNFAVDLGAGRVPGLRLPDAFAPDVAAVIGAPAFQHR